MGKHGLSQAVTSDWAKRKARELSGKYIDMALNDLGKKMSGGKFEIQKELSKLGELHVRTPTGKKYNYCGPERNSMSGSLLVILNGENQSII